MVNTRYKISEKKASSFGGLHTISELLYKIGFKRLFDDVFGTIRKVRSYKPVENLQVLISSILCGGERLSDVDRLRTDSVLPTLFGTGVVPYDTTIRRDLQYIGDYSKSRQEFLYRINEVLLNNTKPESMTIDVDGTATKVEGHQENACKGYCPESPGDRCFQHLIISWDEMDTVLSIDTRGGEVHCIDGADGQMLQVLDRFSDQVDNILVRCDAGFYSDDILDLLEGFDNVEYEVMGAKLDAVVAQIGDRRFKSYHGSEREYAVFHHKIGKGKLRSYYVERYHKDEKMYLFDGMQWDYRVIVSNRSGKQPHTLFREYNLRARQELLIKELKGEFALGKIVSNDFRVTVAAAWVSAICCTLIGLFNRIALRREYRRYRMKRMRYFLFSLVARFARHAGVMVLKILSPPLGEWRYDQIIRRIHALC